MTHYRDPNRVQTVTERTYTWYGWTISHTDLRRLIGLIMLAFVVLNGYDRPALPAPTAGSQSCQPVF